MITAERRYKSVERSEISSYTSSVSRCDDPRLQAYAVILEVVGHLNRIFDRSLRERCGIGQSTFEALFRLASGEMTMGELAEELALTSGGATRLVDRLAEEGLVARRACPDDRRVQFVALTPAGQAKLDEAMEIHLADLDEHLFGLVGEADREQLVAVMGIVRDAMSRRRQAPVGV